MADEEGVVGATLETAKAHPAWIVGGVVGLVAVLWFVSRKKAAEPIAFNYGPSDAQVKAGTALAIAQQADQTQVSLANINATASQAAIGSYFDYLTNHSKDQVAAATAGYASAEHIASINGATADYVAQQNALTAQHGQDTTLALGTTQSNNALATAQAGYAYQTTAAQIAGQTAQLQSNNAVTIAANSALSKQQYDALSQQISSTTGQLSALSGTVGGLAATEADHFNWTRGAIETVQSAGNSLSNWAGDAVAKLGAIINGDSQRLAAIGA